jgi:hypothetical protein
MDAPAQQDFHFRMNTGISKQSTTATAEKTTEAHGILDRKTLDNLSLLRCTAKHLSMSSIFLFAELARKNGNKELADLFEKTANTERFEHFAEEAQLAGLVGSDADNLKDAIKPDTLTAPWKCATLKGTLGRFLDGKPRGPHNFLAYQGRRMRRRRGRG